MRESVYLRLEVAEAGAEAAQAGPSAPVRHYATCDSGAQRNLTPLDGVDPRVIDGKLEWSDSSSVRVQKETRVGMLADESQRERLDMAVRAWRAPTAAHTLISMRALTEQGAVVHLSKTERYIIFFGSRLWISFHYSQWPARRGREGGQRGQTRSLRARGGGSALAAPGGAARADPRGSGASGSAWHL